MAFEFKMYFLTFILLLSVSCSFSQKETYPVSSPIHTTFYEKTNIILKYRCSKGSRKFLLKANTMDCELQNLNEISFKSECYQGQYYFLASFEVNCNNSQTILQTNSVFKACEFDEVNATRRHSTPKALRSKRDLSSNESTSTPSPTTSTTHLSPTTSVKEPEMENKRFTMTAPVEAVYLFQITQLEGPLESDEWQLDYHSPHGYLPPTEWPLLIFYQLSLSLYVFYLVAWLVLCCIYRKDLLQVQYYITFVILLGLLEKVIFVAEYESLNRTGVKNNHGAVVFGELVSALKRTAARILVVVVSVGFGIVIPRLGKTLHYLLVIGLVFFFFASIDGIYTRSEKTVLRRGWKLVVYVGLVIIDTLICYWIFNSLIQVMRKLRLRRNAVKLSVYRHFTNTLIFTMMAAIAYMVWFVITFQRSTCNQSWMWRWVDTAFWPFLFQLILLLIIILWRPSPANDRYSYSPLTDDVDDDEAQEPMMNEAFEGVKNRSKSDNTSARQEPAEETLRWVEDNIPKTVDTVIPKMLDSDEEVENTLFEINKMQ